MPKTEKFELKTKISEELLADLAVKLADECVARDVLKEELSITRTRYNNNIKGKEDLIQELSNQVHSKHHVEKLDCPLNPLPASKRMELLHPNTGEVVHTRPMTADEAKEGYLFEGINDPEKSAENVAGFFDATNETGPQFVGDNDEDSDSEPARVEEIEAGGEQFPKKKVTESPIKFDDDLHFGAVLKVAQDSGDGFHFGYRVASKVTPKASHAIPVYVDSVTYADYDRMLESAAAAMINRLTSDPKFSAMGVDRTRRITDAIQAFCLPENAESAVAN